MNEKVVSLLTSPLLLLLLLVCGGKIRTTDSQAVVDCVPGSDVRKLAFDCSRRHLDLPTLRHKSMEVTHIASSIDFSGNLYAFKLINYAFEKYIMLNDTLMLSANGFEAIEPHAFFSRLAHLSKSGAKSPPPGQERDANPLMVIILRYELGVEFLRS